MKKITLRRWVVIMGLCELCGWSISYGNVAPKGYESAGVGASVGSDGALYVQEAPEGHATTANVRVLLPDTSMGFGLVYDYRLSPAFSVGPRLSYFTDHDGSGVLVGMDGLVSLDSDLNRTGWQLNPFMSYYEGDYNSSSEISSWEGGLNLVHQSMWRSGVNLHWGAGLYYNSDPKDSPLTFGESHWGPRLVFSLGYAF